MFYSVQYMLLYLIIVKLKYDVKDVKDAATRPFLNKFYIFRSFTSYFNLTIIGYNNHILKIVKHNGIPLRSIERLRCMV